MDHAFINAFIKYNEFEIENWNNKEIGNISSFLNGDIQQSLSYHYNGFEMLSLICCTIQLVVVWSWTRTRPRTTLGIALGYITESF